MVHQILPECHKTTRFEEFEPEPAEDFISNRHGHFQKLAAMLSQDMSIVMLGDMLYNINGQGAVLVSNSR